MWFKREISEKIKLNSITRPVVVLTGARQVGKSSLLRKLFPDHHYVTLDLPSEAARARLEPEAFLREHPGPLIIDEIQYAPDLFRHIKILVDEDRGQMGRFILTGSQRFTLMKGVTESLAGRAAVMELEGLSLYEISPKSLDYPLLILRGGYPEVAANGDLSATDYYRDYLRTYLDRDVRDVLNVENLRDFERFLRLCALRTGQMLNKSELARDTGIAPSTAGIWLNVLEASGIVRLLEPWFSNKSKSIVKTPKLYFADTGLLCALLNIRTTDELTRSPLVGAIWETFCFSEMRKRLNVTAGGEEIWYWRDRTKEVDFVIHRGGRFVLAEAKWTETPQPRDAIGMGQAEAFLLPQNILAKVVLSRGRSFPLEGGVSNTNPLDLKGILPHESPASLQ